MAAPDEVSSDAAVASVISERESRANNGSEGFSQWEKMFFALLSAAHGFTNRLCWKRSPPVHLIG